MPVTEILMLAFEALMANKIRALLTMLGMIIGVGAVVLLVSIGNGAKNYITREFEGLGTNLILIQPGKTDAKGAGPMGHVGGSKRKLTLEDVEALERQAFNVEAVTGVVFGTASVKGEETTVNINVLGCNEKFVRIFNVKVLVGQFFGREEDETGRRVVVLGNKVAQDLFGDVSAVGQMVKVNDSEHRVVGVMERRGNSLGFDMDNMVFLPTRAALRIFNDDRLFGIRLKARSRVSIDDAVAEIREILMARMNGDDDFTIGTQVSIMSSMNTILNMLTYVLAGIAMISMVVGGIGIMNIMLVSVTERTREIGIRRAVGARRSDILRQFLAEALALSLTGGAMGLLGSVGLTYLVYLVNPAFDMRAPVWVLPPAFGLSLFTGLLFGVLPASKAAHIKTIDALRYE